MQKKIHYILFVLGLVVSLNLSAQSKYLVVDNARLLSIDEATGLNFMLNGYFNASNVELMFFTIRSLKGRTIEQVATTAAQNFSLGQSGLNNYALLIISTEEQLVHIYSGSGLEWQLTENINQELLSSVDSLIQTKHYSDMAKNVMTQMYNKVSPLPWQVSYSSFTELGYNLKSSEAKIVSFKAKSITKNLVRQPKADIQFDPSYYILVQGDNGKNARLYFSNNMMPAITKIISSSEITINARVGATGPVQLQLLGIE